MDIIFIDELRAATWIGIYPREKAMAQTVEIEVNHRGGVKGQHLAEDQPADDGQAQRLAHFRAFGPA